MYAASILEGWQQLEILKYWLFLPDSPARLCTGWLAMASWWSIYSIKLVSFADCCCLWWLSELKRSYRKWPQCRLNMRVCQNCGHGTGDSIEKRKYSSRIWKLLNDSEVAHVFTDKDVKFQDVSLFSHFLNHIWWWSYQPKFTLKHYTFLFPVLFLHPYPRTHSPKT